MKQAKGTWVEVAFVECPYCGEFNELGSDHKFEKGAIHDCSDCLKSFEVIDPLDSAT